MAGLHDYTTKEVLNKVLLDSSGDAVAAFSHTTQEALNAVLDSSNSRLNVSLTGGTISGDVTISGDLTVSGGGSYAYSEVLTGDMTITQATVGDSALRIIKTGYSSGMFIDHTFNIGTGINSTAIDIDFTKSTATTGGDQYLQGINIAMVDGQSSSGGTSSSITGVYVKTDLDGGT